MIYNLGQSVIVFLTRVPHHQVLTLGRVSISAASQPPHLQLRTSTARHRVPSPAPESVGTPPARTSAPSPGRYLRVDSEQKENKSRYDYGNII